MSSAGGRRRGAGGSEPKQATSEVRVALHWTGESCVIFTTNVVLLSDSVFKDKLFKKRHQTYY